MTADAPRYDLSPTEAGALLGVSSDTVKRWAADGAIPAFRTPGGWWRFREADLLALLPKSSTAPDSCGAGVEGGTADADAPASPVLGGAARSQAVR